MRVLLKEIVHMKSMPVELQSFETVPVVLWAQLEGDPLQALLNIWVWELMITHEFLLFWKLGRSNRECSALILLVSVELQVCSQRPASCGIGRHLSDYLLEDALQDAAGYFLLQRHDLGRVGKIL